MSIRFHVMSSDGRRLTAGMRHIVPLHFTHPPAATLIFK